MTANFPGNPYAGREPRTDTDGIMSALDTLSYEQRTANLIALYSMPDDRFMSRNEWGAVKDAILARLGLDQEGAS